MWKVIGYGIFQQIGIELPMRPTAENLAKYFYEYMADKGYQVIRTTVYETPTNAATYMA